MKKIGILTFHASHNYGSMLQAYALRKYALDAGLDCDIINYRTAKQKDIYAVLTKRKGMRYLVKNAYVLTTYKQHKEKFRLFEKFLQEELACGAELSEDDLKDLQYDQVITGSDQIWNVEANDFSDVYFGNGISCPKIAYAVSCGNGDFKDKSRFDRFGDCLREYDAISVRDKATAALVSSVTGQTPQIVCDPVMLFDKTVWGSLAKKPNVKLPGKYIFLYTLSCTRQVSDVAKKLSQIVGLPVVISKVTSQYDILLKSKKVLNSGPKEFLYLLQNSEFVVTTSYHAMLFSMIFNKKFFTVGSKTDNRQKDLLETFGIEDNIIDETVTAKDIEKVLGMHIDYTQKISDFARNGKRFLEENVL